MMIDAELERLRDEIRLLCARHARGDIRERPFQRALVERTVGLYRALVQRHMTNRETILEEHHVVFSHTKLTQSVLKEPVSCATSLFATEKRLFRLRSTLLPDRPPTCDERDDTVVDSIRYDDIEGLIAHSKVRSGEMLTGLAIAGGAAAFSDWLSITGPLLVCVGVVGCLHGLLMPTRWIEVRPKEHLEESEPILIYALKKKSAQRLVRVIRMAIAGRPLC